MSPAIVTISCIVALQAVANRMHRLLLPLWAVDTQVPPAVLGMMVAAFSLVPSVLAVPVGLLLDRLGPRRLCVVGILLTSLSGLTAVAIPNVPGMTLAQVFLGTSQLLVVAAGHYFVTSVPDARQRGYAAGFFGTVIALGQTAGPLLGGVVHEHTTFTISFLTAAAVGLLPLAVVPWLPGSRPDQEAAGEEITAWHLALRRPVLVMLGVVFTSIFAFGIRDSFYPVHLTTMGFSGTTVGALLAVVGLFTMVSRSLVGWLLPLFGIHRLSAAAMSLGVVSFIITPLVANVWAQGLAAALHGLGFGIMQPLTLLLAAEQTDQARKGLVVGLRMVANRLAGLMNPVLFGLAASLAGSGATFAVSNVFLILGIAIALAGPRRAPPPAG